MAQGYTENETKNINERVFGNFTVEFTGAGWGVFTNNEDGYGYTCLTDEPMPGDEGKAEAIADAKRLYEEEG